MAKSRLFQFLKMFLKDSDVRFLSVMLLLALLCGTVLFTWLEGWSPLESLYYSLMTMTTVGFGDFVPVTTGGKIATMLYVLGGIAIFFTYVSVFTHLSLRHHSAESHKKKL